MMLILQTPTAKRIQRVEMIRAILPTTQPTPLIVTDRTRHVVAAFDFLYPAPALRTKLHLFSLRPGVVGPVLILVAGEVLVPYVVAVEA
jgi:hypothetical protein